MPPPKPPMAILGGEDYRVAKANNKKNHSLTCMEATMSEQWATVSHEPTLEEMFNDPIIQLMMRRDGVRVEELQTHLHRAQNGASGRADRQPRF